MKNNLRYFFCIIMLVTLKMTLHVLIVVEAMLNLISFEELVLYLTVQ